MKKLLHAAVAVLLLSTAACESDQERELRLERNHQIRMAKIASGQDAIEQEQRHERSLARIHRPVAPGSYIDYRGNPEYGYWNNGSWAWNNPNSMYATQSRSYVDYQIATGALVAGAILTQASWNRNHSGGWKKQNITVNNYTSTSGKTISKEKYQASNAKIKKAAAKRKVKASKNPVVKSKPKAKGKWESKRTTKPTYAKGGFKNNFSTNKKKVAKKTKPKSSYSKPKPRKTTYKSKSSKNRR